MAESKKAAEEREGTYAGEGDAPEKDADSSVASAKENAKLEHAEGGMTTRQDAADLGVPMLPGDPSEPVGPEDALGPGPKRGDYSERVGPVDYHPHQAVVEDGAYKMEAQRPRAEERGDEAGKKGGVV